MNYLLDTNVVIALLKNDPPAVRKRFKRAAAGGATMMISSVVLFELWYGVARSRHQKDNAERLRTVLSGGLGVISFVEEDAVIAGNLRAALETRGKPIGPYDLMIAAQAIRARATLVSANVAEFARVGGLKWQDWSA